MGLLELFCSPSSSIYTQLSDYLILYKVLEKTTLLDLPVHFPKDQATFTKNTLCPSEAARVK